MNQRQRQYMQNFRAANPRFDYFPMPDAFAAIVKAQRLFPTFNRREILDILVEKGLCTLEREAHRTQETGASIAPRLDI